MVHSDDYTGKVTIIGVYPHPITAQGSAIAVHLPYHGELTVKIWTMNGEPVVSFAKTYAVSGSYEVMWNARNDLGAPLAFGSYYLQVELEGAGAHSRTGRWITVLR